MILKQFVLGYIFIQMCFSFVYLCVPFYWKSNTTLLVTHKFKSTIRTILLIQHNFIFYKFRP